MNYKLPLISLIWFFVLSACNHTDPTEFEDASGMQIPASATEKESFDDGKLVKVNSFVADSIALVKFVEDQEFSRFTNDQIPQFWGAHYLKEKPDFSHIDFFYYKSGSSGTLSWIYIADLKSSTLWTEIKYPGKPSY
jgi:hypothetical protein